MRQGNCSLLSGDKLFEVLLLPVSAIAFGLMMILIAAAYGG